MGELDDNFTSLLGRQPTDKERQNLYRVRDALKVKATDSVWMLLMVLQHYETLYEQFPARIAAASDHVTTAARTAAEAAAKAAQEQTKRALMEAVREAAVRSATDAAGAQLTKWVSIAGGVICVSLVIVGWSALAYGRRSGEASGENGANRRCAALVEAGSWASTPEGRLAFEFAKAGNLRDVATCSRPGWEIKGDQCIVRPHRGAVYGWRVPIPSHGSE